MASDGTPVAEALPSELGNAIAVLNTWSNPDLQAKLAELGAPNMGKKRKKIRSEDFIRNGFSAFLAS